MGLSKIPGVKEEKEIFAQDFESTRKSLPKFRKPKKSKRSVMGFGDGDFIHGGDFWNNEEFLEWLEDVKYNFSVFESSYF